MLPAVFTLFCCQRLTAVLHFIETCHSFLFFFSFLTPHSTPSCCGVQPVSSLVQVPCEGRGSKCPQKWYLALDLLCLPNLPEDPQSSLFLPPLVILLPLGGSLGFLQAGITGGRRWRGHFCSM